MIRKTRTPYRFAIPSVAAAALLAGAPAALGQNLALRGTIRDFRSTHVDFAPGLAPGHYAGNAGLTLGSDEKPDYTGGGYEVVSQWRDEAGRPIAPNMFFKGTVPVYIDSAPIMSSPSYLDAFDYTTGTYDPARAGEAAFVTGSTMPTVTAPVMGVPKTSNVLRDKKEVSVLSGDLHVDEFRIRTGHTLQIDGEVTMFVEKAFELNNQSQIELLSGATLTIYAAGTFRIEQQSKLNANTRDPLRVNIYNLGTSPITVDNYTDVYANLVSPRAPLELNNNVNYFGAVMAESVHLYNSSALHAHGVPNVCDLKLADTRGSAGGPGGGVSSAFTFGQWFNDAMGVNAGRPHTLLLSNDGSGMYSYSDDRFFPIDGKLYGNEGAEHNYRFTYEVRATFTYEACAGQSVWFEGSDDCWIYIDDQLVIDLGGVAPGAGQYINIDRLDLVDGEMYTFRLFYAHRTGNTPRFNLRTNIELVPEPVTAGVSSFPRHD